MGGKAEELRTESSVGGNVLVKGIYTDSNVKRKNKCSKRKGKICVWRISYL